MRTDLFIECNGKQTDYKMLTETAKEIWKSEGNKVKDLDAVELYFKPEEKTCYYIFNSDIKGSFEV